MQAFHSAFALRILNSSMLCLLPECYFASSLPTLELLQLTSPAFFFSILLESRTSSLCLSHGHDHLVVSVDRHSFFYYVLQLHNIFKLYKGHTSPRNDPFTLTGCSRGDRGQLFQEAIWGQLARHTAFTRPPPLLPVWTTTTTTEELLKLPFLHRVFYGHQDNV